MRAYTYIAIMIVSGCLNGFSQEKFEFSGGRLETWSEYLSPSANYYGNESLTLQYGMFVSQDLEIYGLPFSVQGNYNNNYKNNNYVYPNFINIQFNGLKYRQNTIEKISEQNRSRYLSEIKKKTDRQNLLRKIEQIDMMRSGQDIESLENLKQLYLKRSLATKVTDSVEYYNSMVKDIEEKQGAWAQLDSIKNMFRSQESRIQFNDSVVNKYKPINYQDITKNRNLYDVNSLMNVGMKTEYINIGRFTFSEHPFISQNTYVDGVSMKMQPEALYFSAVFGKVNLLNPGISLNYTERVNLAGGSAGYSTQSSSTEVYLYHYYGNNLVVNDVSGVFHKSALTKNVAIELILSGSQKNNNENFSQIYYQDGLPVEYTYNRNNFLYNILFQNKSFDFSTGYAADAKVSFSGLFKNNRLMLGTDYISPYYSSVSSPFLINDISTAYISAEQKLFKNKVRLIVTERIRKNGPNEFSFRDFDFTSTRIQAGFKLHENLLWSGTFQFNERRGVQYPVNYLYNTSLIYKENTFIKSSHNIFVTILRNKTYNNVYNLNYMLTLPVSRSVSVSTGYSGNIISDNVSHSVVNEWTINYSKKITQLAGIRYSVDPKVEEWAGMAGIRMLLLKNFNAEILSQFGKNRITNIYNEIYDKNRLTGKVKLTFLW